MTSAPCCSPFVDHLDLAGDRGQRREQVAEPREDAGLAVDECARRSRFETRISIAEIGMRADTPEDWSTNSELARRERDLLDELAEELRNLDVGSSPARSTHASCVGDRSRRSSRRRGSA